MSEKVKTNISLNHNVFIFWRPEYDLGIHIIDEQHRGVMSVINSLHYAMQHKHAESILTSAMNMIQEYTRIHFDLEENFFEICKFPNLKGHHELHRELIDTLSKFKNENKWTRDPHQFMEFLKTWWISHICNEDRVFLNYLSEHKS